MFCVTIFFERERVRERERERDSVHVLHVLLSPVLRCPPHGGKLECSWEASSARRESRSGCPGLQLDVREGEGVRGGGRRRRGQSKGRRMNGGR